ncbi:ABC transporter ATP-binding protein [Paenibacillus thalictri]|uniref:ABC transporter ATP-binding protein n=1 Tax=Paenibacillus thalictri TaxID=2527873 RepID=A0A4Q9DW02_9BACL|nr:ABC transporter ATP-binding protein [Paenibacillus thalictri]TBL79171.1 ABC transporter ATP-binding protein [Paenibacillus thalictri]
MSWLYGPPPLLPAARETDGQRKKVKVNDWKTTLRSIWFYLSAYKRTLLGVTLLIVISASLSLLGPFLLGVLIDSYLVKRNGAELLALIGLMGVIYAVQTGATLLQNYTMIGVAQRAVAAIRADLFAKLHRLPIPFYANKQAGELMSRFTNDIDNISQMLGSSFIQLVSSTITFVGMLSLMLWLSPILTLVMLTVFPAMYYGMKWITARTGPLFKAQQRDLGALAGFLEEKLSGQLIVKAFSKQNDVLNEFSGLNKELRTSAYWAQTYSGFISKLMILLNNMSFAVIAGVGGVLAFQGMITIGVIVTFIEYARQFVRPLNDLSTQVNTMLSAVAGAERVFEISRDREEEDEEGAVDLEEVHGDIEFSQVNFSYGQSAKTLSEVSFRVWPGQTIALVGPTGAGKTTVVQLLSRFYETNGGSIRVDGHDIRRIRRSSLRRHMGFVLQDSILFETTVRENIRYGRLDATDGEVEEAARLANAHLFITRLPNGYDTVLLKGGGAISHGQRQLLAIARAILADPSILILDEATSSVDTVTEMNIQEALQRLMKGRTNVVIAHRLNTIRQADVIAVLDNGRIVEHGTHDALLENQGVYYELYKGK